MYVRFPTLVLGLNPRLAELTLKVQCVNGLFYLEHQLSRQKPGYNDIGLCDTSFITPDMLWYQLIPHTINRNIIIPGYNDTKYSVPFKAL